MLFVEAGLLFVEAVAVVRRGCVRVDGVVGLRGVAGLVAVAGLEMSCRGGCPLEGPEGLGDRRLTIAGFGSVWRGRWRSNSPVPPTSMRMGQSMRPAAPTAASVSAAVGVDRDPLWRPWATPRIAPRTPPMAPSAAAAPTAPAVSVIAVAAVLATVSGRVSSPIGHAPCVSVPAVETGASVRPHKLTHAWCWPQRAGRCDCLTCRVDLGRSLMSAVTFARAGVAAVSEAVGASSSRRCWAGAGRAWIEVRGLDDAGADDLAGNVVTALGAIAGVEWVEVNRTLARVVVSIPSGDVKVNDLVAVLEVCERAAADAYRKPVEDGSCAVPARAPVLPGDAAVLAGRMVALGADAAGLAVALTGRVLRLPRLPGVVAAAAVLIDVQPRLRRVVEARLGVEAADVALAVATATAQALTQGPASLTVDLTLRAMLVAEARAGRRAWERHESLLAAAPACDEPFPVLDRPRPRSSGPIEKYSAVAAVGGLVGAGAVGIATGKVGPAADAVLVAAPRATRAARESFSATLCQHLCDDDGVLVLHPEALRLLDRIDALVVDTHALLTETLTVGEVRGAEGDIRTALWVAARSDVESGLLGVGWHSTLALSPIHDELAFPGDARVLVTAVADPLAGAVVSAARQARLVLVSVDGDELGSFRAGFDHLEVPLSTVDATLCAAVKSLQTAGRTVAVLAVDAPHALAAADLGMAMTRGKSAPGWTADMLLPDLGGVWRLLSAVPAARSTSRRGVELSAGASLLGALLMLPGVRGRGPGPVVAAAAFGLLNGRAAALRVARLPLPDPRPVIDFHALSVSEALKALAESGLPRPVESSISPPGWQTGFGSVGVRWQQTSSPLRGAIRLVNAARAELADPLTPILATGAAASAVLGSPVDAVLVGSVMLGNAVLSAVQRLRAEELLGRLLASHDPLARLVTPGPGGSVNATMIASSDLSPGQLIEVRGGEIVPADARLVTVEGVEVDESSLTGESLPVSKSVTSTPGAPLAERSCMLFEGTTVLTGTATAIVTAVGAGTEAGRAANLAPPRVHDVGLQSQLGVLTARILPLTVGAGAVVTALGWLRGTGLREAVTSGVAISVAAVPEGLPLVATLAQQAAARRLTRHGVLVRSPRAIEALGRVDVVCFDKTGTLTENRLRVAEVQPMPGRSRRAVLSRAALACAQPRPGQALQHATDIAVLDTFAGPIPPRQAELAFRAGRSFAASVSNLMLSVKGAPEVLIDASRAPDTIMKQVHEMAARGLRVIAVAERRLTKLQAVRAAGDDTELEKLCRDKLNIVGLIGLADTARPDAIGLLQKLIDSGRSVRVITGDHPLTAITIVAELGLQIDIKQILTGSDWAQLSLDEQSEAVERVVVFARMSPEQKVQVVQILEGAGHVCAMVGDGANDAAAIRVASIGIGVATHGSDPARGAADVVLTDSKIGSLIEALDEGTQLWQRTQAALSVLLGGNAGEVAFTMLGTAVSGRAPLNARQLLIVNLLTDAFPAAAVAVSAPTSPPSRTRGLDEAQLFRTISMRGAATTLGATSAWTLARLTGTRRHAATVGLVALVATQLGQTLLDSHSKLVVVTAAGSLAALALIVNTPGVSQLMGCTPLGPIGWSQALTCAAGATAVAGLVPSLLPTLKPVLPHQPRIRTQPAGQHPDERAPSKSTVPVGSAGP